MTELERALVLLGERLAFPETPDVAEPVLGRIAAGPAPARFRRRLALVAAAVLAVAVGVVLAVPQARSAILELFGLRGATVQRVESLPTVPRSTAQALDLGQQLSLVDGRPSVQLPEVLVPRALGPPDAAYLSSESYGRRLTLVYEPGAGIPASPFTGVGLLVSEFAGEPDPGYVHKLVDSGTNVERVRVGPYPGLWLEGGPHAVLFKGDAGQVFEDRGRLAENTLLVDRDDVLVRIEGAVDRDRALEIAESLAPP